MKTTTALLILLAAITGCTFSRSGSQAIDFEPSNIGTNQPAITPANGPGFMNGEALDQRNSR